MIINHNRFREILKDWRTLEGNYEDIVKETEAFPIALPDFSNEDESRNFILCQWRFYEFKAGYEKTKDPICAMDAFMFSCSRGYDIPCWVTEWLYSAFVEFEKHQGTVSVQDLLGFKNKQRTGSLFKKRAIHERNFSLCRHVHLLHAASGLNIIKCAEIVNHIYRVTIKQDPFYSAYKLLNMDQVTISPSSIERLYRENYKESKDNYNLDFVLASEFRSKADAISYILEHYDYLESAVNDKDVSFSKEDLQAINTLINPD